MKYQSKKQIGWFIFLLSATYMVSYITRINFGAVLVEMERATHFSKTTLALALTSSFVTYSLGQLVSGVLGDKISPKRLVALGLLLTSGMNWCVPLVTTAHTLVGVWCINGFAQSLLWPPMVKMMSGFLNREEYNNAVTRVNYGSSVGTVAVYLIAPLLIASFGYAGVFRGAALLGCVMLGLWLTFAKDLPKEEAVSSSLEKQKTNSSQKWFTPLLFGVMVAIVLQGMLRDGVTSWMPTYVAETYSLESSVAIVSGVVLPIFAILCYGLANILHKKKLTNPITCATVFFGGGMVSVAVLCFVSGSSLFLSVLCSALLTGCMHGVNLLLVCMIPAYFEGKGKVATVSGVINACSYVGSALSTYGIAVLCENAGWSVTLLTWAGVALLGTLLCGLLIAKWRKQYG